MKEQSLAVLLVDRSVADSAESSAVQKVAMSVGLRAVLWVETTAVLLVGTKVESTVGSLAETMAALTVVRSVENLVASRAVMLVEHSVVQKVDYWAGHLVEQLAATMAA